MGNSLGTLVEFGVPVNSVLDVGVQRCTSPLMVAFPDVNHYLFEPVDAYFQDIRRAYKDLHYELFHVALSDVDGEAWQVGVSRDDSGQVTHSQISERQVTVEEEPQLVECKAIRRARLDTILTGVRPLQPWLLKIDVDGHELPILRGSPETLRHASIVVIEAPLTTLLGRAGFLEDSGFQLFDIIDLSYYYGTMSQVDLVFVRRDIVASNENLRPWQTKTFAWEAWEPQGDQFFRPR